VLEILQLQDYAKPSLENGEWMTTPVGETVSGATTPQFPLGSVDRALASLAERIDGLNRAQETSFHVEHAVAFGDFLKKGARVQAADVGIRLRLRNGTAVDSAEQSGIFGELRAKSRHLHLRAFEDWMSVRTHRNLMSSRSKKGR
jgi:hypothetical protein